MERRRFAASLLSLPAAARAKTAALPPPSLADFDPEKYWSRIRDEQFYLPKSRVFLNNGSLGVAPRATVAAVNAYLEKSAAMEMEGYEYPRWGYETLEAHRAEVAAFLGCRAEDLALTHNATEALGAIAAGLDLKAGDEVVMTDQEHPSGKAGWSIRAARHGITIREVPIPLPPPSPAELAGRMISALGPRTRVLFFSAITTTTGLILPVKEICSAARAKGVISVVDGAHVHGQIPLPIDSLGCDYFAGSPHKWMFAPAGCGFLWARPEMLERLWPSVATGNWDNRKLNAARFMLMGTNNRAIFEGLIAGLRFGNQIGWDRIYRRTHELARRARAQAERLGYLRLVTPDNDTQYGSLVTFELGSIDRGKLFAECDRRRIWILRAQRMRLSAHIHTRPSDFDAFFDAVETVRRGG
jgi:selenocysteine lyase/cysteine desulfurase